MAHPPGTGPAAGHSGADGLRGAHARPLVCFNSAADSPPVGRRQAVVNPCAPSHENAVRRWGPPPFQSNLNRYAASKPQYKDRRLESMKKHTVRSEHHKDGPDFCTIGIDVSKHHLDACELPSGREARFPNTKEGVRAFSAWACPRVARVVYESTGSLPLAAGGPAGRPAAAVADQPQAWQALRRSAGFGSEDGSCGRAGAGEDGPSDGGRPDGDAGAYSTGEGSG